jgi:hypothetical protein
MEPGVRRLTLAVTVLAALASAECGKQQASQAPPEPLAVEGSAEFIQQGRQEKVRITVRTAPLAEIRIHRGPNWNDWPGEQRATADAQGVATFVVYSPGYAETADISVTAALESENRQGTASIARPRRAVVLEVDDENLRCKDGPDCSVSLASAGEVEVTAPAGTRYEIAGHSGTVAEGGQARIPLDLAPLLAGIHPGRLAGAAGEFPPLPSLPVQLVLPDGPTLTAQWSLGIGALRRVTQTWLAAVREHPVLFPEEGTGRAIVLLVPDGVPRFVGEPQRLADVGLVAVSEVQERREKCGTYGRTEGTRTETIEISKTFRDRAIAVYDRRTGALDAERLMRAPDFPCPRETERTAAVASFVSHEDVTKWLAQKYR